VVVVQAPTILSPRKILLVAVILLGVSNEDDDDDDDFCSIICISDTQPCRCSSEVVNRPAPDPAVVC